MVRSENRFDLQPLQPHLGRQEVTGGWQFKVGMPESSAPSFLRFSTVMNSETSVGGFPGVVSSDGASIESCRLDRPRFFTTRRLPGKKLERGESRGVVVVHGCWPACRHPHQTFPLPWRTPLGPPAAIAATGRDFPDNLRGFGAAG
jgi:hypothetical protein